MNLENDILGFDGLTIYDYEIDVLKDGNKHVTFKAELTRHPKMVCRKCDSTHFNNHGSIIRTVEDLPIFDKKTTVEVKLIRYKCMECGTTTQEDLSEFVEKGANISNRLREAVAREGAKNGFAAAAIKYDLSDTAAKQAFNRWAEILESQKEKIVAPRVLGIDEAHLGTEVRDMRSVFTDIENGILLEVGENRKKETIIETIREMQMYDINIEAITIDMNKGYREAAYEVFGKNKIYVIIDHFHVIQDLSRKAVKARQAIVKEAGSPKLGKNATLMKVNYENLTDKKKEELSNHFAAIPDLGILYALKESFRTLYNCKSREEAEEKYQIWKKQIPNKETFKPIKKFAKTVDNWHREIFNYFDCPYSNATTEAINGLIKRVNSLGRGYEFNTLRHKLLFGLQASQMPLEEVFTVRKKANNSTEGTINYINWSNLSNFSTKEYNSFLQRATEKTVKIEYFKVSIPRLEKAIDGGLIYLGENDIYDANMLVDSYGDNDD